MASKKKKAAAAAGGAAATAKAAKDNKYVQEIVENDDLRENIQEAYESARDAYERIASSKKPAKAIFDDKKLQKDLKNAADSIRDAGLTLRDAPTKAQKSGGGMGRKLLLVIVAAGLAVALSEDLRKKVLDMLFGAEEEFEYTSTSTSNSGGASGGVSTPAASSS